MGFIKVVGYSLILQSVSLQLRIPIVEMSIRTTPTPHFIKNLWIFEKANLGFNNG